VTVPLIDRSNHHLFQPLLYQVATAGLSPADIATPIRSILRSHPNTETIMAEVEGIDRTGRKVKLKGAGEIHYDFLVVATGASYTYFGHDEWASLAPGLKTVTDATEIRRRILRAFETAEMHAEMKLDPDAACEWLSFVIVGGGPTGVEVAGSIGELARFALTQDFRHIDTRSTQIFVIEAGPRLLAAFPTELAHRAATALKKLGVVVRTGARVEQVLPDGVMVQGEKIRARTVIWAAGVVASQAGHWLSAEMDRHGRVKVSPDLSLPGNPEIFVIGDTSTLEQDGKPLPGLAPVAIQEGRFVARLLNERARGRPGPTTFHYVDKGNLATVGRTYAIADIHGLKLYGFVGWIVWAIVHIYFLIGFRNRAMVVMEWSWAWLTFGRGARLITDRS
jgi:NADH dehydrogenase